MRLTIGLKMGLGFGVLLTLVVVVFVITYSTTKSNLITLSEGINQNEFIKTYSSPALSNLQRLRDNVEESKNLIVRWATVPSYTEHPDKKRFLKIKDTILPMDIKPSLISNKDSLPISVQDSIDVVFRELDELFLRYREIQNLFPNLASYDSVFNNMQATFLIADDGIMLSKARKVTRGLDQLIATVRADNQRRTVEMNTAFGLAEDESKRLINLVLYFALLLFAVGIVVALLTTRSITRPVNKLKGMLIKLGKGKIPEGLIQPSNDEIGDMSVAMNNLVKGLNHTTEFANHVGQSNFDYDYKPMSDEDTLGHALMKMRDDLAENERLSGSTPSREMVKVGLVREVFHAAVDEDNSAVLSSCFMKCWSQIWQFS